MSKPFVLTNNSCFTDRLKLRQHKTAPMRTLVAEDFARARLLKINLAQCNPKQEYRTNNTPSPLENNKDDLHLIVKCAFG